MKISKFKSGKKLKQDDYYCFIPNPINFEWEIDNIKITNLLSKAERELSKLNSYSRLIPDVDLYIKMYANVEASKSNEIEGTRTSIEENLISEENISPEKRDDWDEVQNYIKAMNYGVNKIASNELPLCNRLIREMHEILLEGVRGNHKTPGFFRTSQNWIGGATISDAIFIPPHAGIVNELMSDLEKFMNDSKLYVPDLVKCAIIHYQFETIHPFLDGNGRMGRLMIPLYLQDKGLLDKPCLYISAYFEKNRNKYYANLSSVRIDNNMNNWIEFFLNGIIETSVTASEKFMNVVSLREKTDRRLKELKGNITNYDKIMYYFYRETFLSMSQIIKYTNINDRTLRRLINELIDNKIIIEIEYNQKRLFCFEEYIKIFLH